MNIAFGSGHQTYTRIKTDLERIIRRFNPMSGQDPVDILEIYFQGKIHEWFLLEKNLCCEYSGNVMVKR